MNLSHRNRCPAGLTLLEVMVVVAILIVVGILALSPGSRKGEPTRRAVCASNLKILAVAEKHWELDHAGRFSWQESTNRGGTVEHADSPEVFRHFDAIVDEIEIPRVLVCPSDQQRTAARSFGPRFSNTNVSYFVGLDADARHPQGFLFGDRNIAGGVRTLSSAAFYQTNIPSWPRTIHDGSGDIVTADGSVSALNSSALRECMKEAIDSQTNGLMRLAIPRLPGE